MLNPNQTIGGSKIDPAYPTVFPVMDDITVWRLRPGWGIDPVDAERKIRVSFFAPDNAYVVQPETDDIVTIEQR